MAEAERAAEQAKIEASARRITEEVAAARELPVTGEFAVELIDRKGVRAFVEEAIYEEMTRDELALLGRIDASLGILPIGSDFEQLLLDMYETGVLGIYDPKRKTLLIGDYVDRGQLGMVVGHEGAHGLQDMHFDLEALNHMNKGHSDSDTAQTFLIEGDAQAAYLAWVSGDDGLTGISDEILQLQADLVLRIREDMGIPHTILARQMQMPYSDGTMNVLRLARDEGWAAVDALYAELPASSEQMLHPDKLRTREAPIPVTIDAEILIALAQDQTPDPDPSDPDPSDPDPAREVVWEVVWEDELGEATILAMLAEVAGVGAARAAAAGWGGDRFVALDRKTDPAAAPLVIGVVTWDTRADAKQFESLFRTYLEARRPGAFSLVRRRSSVLYATELEDTLTGAAVSKAGWSAFTIGNKP